MTINPDPACVQKQIDEGRGYAAYHELITAPMCIFIIHYIIRSSFLRNAYKWDLLPLALARLIEACLYAAYYAVPYAACYGHDNRPMYLSFIISSWFAISMLQHYHMLLRQLLSSRFKLNGLIFAVIFPLLLVIVPTIHYVLRYWRTHFWWRVAHAIACVCVTLNTAIAVYLTRTGQVNNAFPCLIAVNEFMHSVTEIAKHLFAFEFGKTGAYYLINYVDDYIFFVTGPLYIFALVWEKRRSLRSFENQNANCDSNFDSAELKA